MAIVLVGKKAQGIDSVEHSKLISVYLNYPIRVQVV